MREELLKLLQENLTIDVERDYPYDPFGSGLSDTIRIKVFFDGKLVAEGSS